jgi:hypothetical protein
MQTRLFLTGSIALPASRGLQAVAHCEHLHQNLLWACISRIHVQLPVVRTDRMRKRCGAEQLDLTEETCSTSPSNTPSREHVRLIFGWAKNREERADLIVYQSAPDFFHDSAASGL